MYRLLVKLNTNKTSRLANYGGEKIIGVANKKGNRKRGSYANDQLSHSFYSPHENRKIERRVRLNILIDCEIALKKATLTPGSEAVSIVVHESVDRGSNAILVDLIAAASENCRVGYLVKWKRSWKII